MPNVLLQDVCDLLKPFSPALMLRHEVSSRVNLVKNNDAACAEPVTRTDAADVYSYCTQLTYAIPTSNFVRLTSCRRGVSVMNKDEVKGKMKDVVGRAERKLGEATGNMKTEARGVARQAEGKVQQIVGKVKNTIRKKKVA